MPEALHKQHRAPQLGPLGWCITSSKTSELADAGWRGGQIYDIAGTLFASLKLVFVPYQAEGRIFPYSPAGPTGPSEIPLGFRVFDETRDTQDELTALELLAELRNESGFIQVAERIDWSQRPASDFTRGVRLALAAGAHLFARNLAALGAQRYPNHQELQVTSRVLAPPRVLRTDVPPDPSWRANRVWLSSHADEYRGQWVALQEGELLAFAATVGALRSQLDSVGGVMITKVP